jgi:hypothetical protein
MRNLVLASALSLSLAGCATAPVPAPSPVATPATGIVSQVQSATVTACKFLPTAQTVLNLAGLFTDVSALGPVTSIAQQICAAVAAPAGRLGRRAEPRVRGVAIKGRFVR